MFGKLKDKLKNWTKSFSKKAVEETVEEIEEETAEVEEVKEKKPEAKEKKVIKELKEKAEIPEKTSKPIKIGPVAEEAKEEPVVEKEGPLQLKEGKEKESRDYPLQTPKASEGGRVRVSSEEPIISKEKPTTPKEKGFFKKITSKISKVKISEKDFEVYSEELEMLLLENNVALEVAEKITKRLKEELVGKELLKKEVEGEIKDSFKDIIREILVEPFDLVEKIKEKSLDQSKEPYVVLFCGINGTGKTTTIAKIARQLKEKNISCVMAAADTFRAASIEQIKKHGERLGVKVISNNYGSDPASVGFDAIQYAKKNFINCVLIDTAGRMHTSKNLLKEIEKIARVCKPDTKIFVGESLTGNDAIEQVKSFDWEIGIDGIILTKADIDEKGGTALSVGYVTKKPILYLGTGQEYDRIEPFNKEKFIERLGL